MTMSAAEALNSETLGTTLLSRILALFPSARTQKAAVAEMTRVDLDATFRQVVTGFAHLG